MLAESGMCMSRRNSTEMGQGRSSLGAALRGSVKGTERRSVRVAQLERGSVGGGQPPEFSTDRTKIVSKVSQRYADRPVAKAAADFVVVVGQDKTLKMGAINSTHLKTKHYGSNANDQHRGPEEGTAPEPTRSPFTSQTQTKTSPQSNMLSEARMSLFSFHEKQANVKIIHEYTSSSLNKQRYQWLKGLKSKGVNREKCFSSSKDCLERTKATKKP